MVLQKKIRKTQNLCLTSLYFPHSGYKEKEQFNSDVSYFLSTLLSQNNTAHIIGADTNSSIGIKSSFCSRETLPKKHESCHDVDPILNLIGPDENPHKLKIGDSILNLMEEHRLRAASTFLTIIERTTWLGLPNSVTGKRKSYQQLCQTTNVKHKFNCIVGDHAALLIEFYFLTSSFLKNNQQQKQQMCRENPPPPG